MLVKLFELAESPLFFKDEYFWVDILKGAIHRTYDLKSLKSNNVAFELGENISNLVTCTNKRFLATGERCIYVCDLEANTKAVLQTFNDWSLFLRCNDGSVGPDGKYWFGTMEKAPSGLNGRLYSMDSKGNLVEQGAAIGIPNSFIWLNERFVLISDSFLQKTFKVELLESGKLDWVNREVWLDLSHTDGTPDGGALDADGNVWLAVWGDASIHKYSPDAVLLEKIELNALQPTSCAFGGVNMDELLITTATEGLSSEQLSQYPDSGKVILRKMDVKGKVLPVFNLEV